MTANDLTFGIEIETTIPTGAIAVGPHGNGCPVPQLRGEWLADADPSIRRTAGRTGCEFVSPVFKGAEGLRQLIADIATIRAMGATVNASCGLHIHVGFDKSDAAGLEKLTQLVANSEKAIFASTGTKSRENGRWCNSIQRHGDANSAIAHSRSYRYHILNLSTSKPTVEFRAFAGTTSTLKIIGHVLTCLGLVEKAQSMKRLAKWTAKTPVATSPIHRGGEGQTALNRLFYLLGWTKGREDYTFGGLDCPTAPTIKNLKKTLMSLAKKYDGAV